MTITLTRCGVRSQADIQLGEFQIVKIDDVPVGKPFILRFDSLESSALDGWQETFASSAAAHRALAQYARQWEATGHFTDLDLIT